MCQARRGMPDFSRILTLPVRIYLQYRPVTRLSQRFKSFDLWHFLLVVYCRGVSIVTRAVRPASPGVSLVLAPVSVIWLMRRTSDAGQANSNGDVVVLICGQSSPFCFFKCANLGAWYLGCFSSNDLFFVWRHLLFSVSVR